MYMLQDVIDFLVLKNNEVPVIIYVYGVLHDKTLYYLLT